MALARCGETATTAKLQAELERKRPAIQPYRKRLIETGVLASPSASTPSTLDTTDGLLGCIAGSPPTIAWFARL